MDGRTKDLPKQYRVRGNKNKLNPMLPGTAWRIRVNITKEINSA